MGMVLSIAAGGAVGAVARHWISNGVQSFTAMQFPFGTLVVNVLGCAVLGALITASALVWSPSQEFRAFLFVGMLGALTTFSAFSMEVVLMIERGEWLHAGMYVVASTVLSVGATLTAMACMRWVIA